MTLQTFGHESTVWTGGQEYIEMEPRKWYEIASCTIIENQFPRPLLITYEQPALMPWPANTYDPEWQYSPIKESLLDTPELVWPSPHFREAITAFTIKAGEIWKAGRTSYIMSTHYRNQPIDTSGVIFADWEPCEKELPLPPVKTEIGFYTNLLGPGTYTTADFADGAGVLTFMVSAETDDAVAYLSGKNGVAIPVFCGEAKGKSEATFDRATGEYCPITDVTLVVESGEVEIIGECITV